MRGKQVTVVGSGPAALDSELIARVMNEWPEAGRPSLHKVTLDQALSDPSSLEHCGIVWIVLEDTAAGGLYSLLSTMQDRHLSGVLTRAGETLALGSAFQDGMVIAPAEAPAASIAAILRTLWCQAGVVRSLQAEIQALQAHHGGLSDQMNKIDEELRLAAQLQREFLPAKLPRVGPVEFHVFFRPAGYVSGDIYDVLQLDEHHVGFFVADAVGHGVPAALMTMYIKRCLHTKAVDPREPKGYRIIPPNEALAMLNHDMVQQQASTKVRFATACYGVLNCETLELSFARAGHPYPLILHADGTTELLEPDGGMLGIFPDEKYELLHCRLRAGDRMLLYSDGFELAFPHIDELHGKPTSVASQRYAEEFKRFAHGPLDLALDRLIGSLDRQAGSLNQRDDLTVICLGVEAAPVDAFAARAKRTEAVALR